MAGNPERFLEILKKLLVAERIPGVAGMLIAALLGIATWKGALDVYAPAFEAVGGPAMTMLNILSTPAVPIAVALFSGLYLWAVSDKKVTVEERRFHAVVCWSSIAVFVIPFCMLSLFGLFVTESKIPQLVEYVERVTEDRHITPEQYNTMYKALRSRADALPTFSVESSRDPEALQYAAEFMNLFYAAGIALSNGEAGSSFPIPRDIYSTQNRGVMIGVANPHGPPKPALDLRDAIQSSGTHVVFIGITGAPTNDFFLLIGSR
jgi:hypothetical protein